jgi:hypothetical protein
MKLRFGEFPEDHHFILITRPFVEWTFKVLGWLIFTSTIQFAYQKTNNQILLYLKWTCYLLLLAFIGAFVDWILNFRRYRIISGKKLVATAEASAASSPKSESWFRKAGKKTRRAVAVVVSITVTIALIGQAILRLIRLLSHLSNSNKKIK